MQKSWFSIVFMAIYRKIPWQTILSTMANLPGPQRSAEENQVRVLCRVEELQGTLPLLQRSTNPRYEGIQMAFKMGKHRKLDVYY
jgi:hypothetical protein